MLGIAVFLLYFNGVIALLQLLGIINGVSPWFLLGLAIAPDLADVFQLVAVLGYFAGAVFIANSQRRGWLIATVVAVGAAVAPILAPVIEPLISFRVELGWLFDLALAGLLLHPQSRAYQKTWFN